MIDQVLGGRYKLLAPLGTGGMARVFEAQDLRLGRRVAVKILHAQYATDATFLRRFDQEARLAAGLSHPNLVSVFDVGQDGDLHYIVMEYIQGETLKELIARRHGPLPLDQALDIAMQVCGALEAVHQHGMVHRDVKAQNILIARPGRPPTPPLDQYGATRTIPPQQPGAPLGTLDLGEGPVMVKVADFGIAHEMAGPSFTTTGMVMGSVHYFAPEQARGQPATPRSDLYAVGIVLYEMLTGRLPFDADNQMAVAMQQLQQLPIPPSRINPSIPAAVEGIVLKALAKNPDARYASAPEMMQALATVRRGAVDATLRATRRDATAPTAVVPRTPPPMPPRPATAPRPAVVPPAARVQPVARAADPTRGILAGVLIGLIVLLLILVAVYALLTHGGGPSGGGSATATPTTAATTAAPTQTSVSPTRTPVPPSPTSRPAVAPPATAPPSKTPTPALVDTATGAPTDTPLPVDTATPVPPTKTPLPPTETPPPPTETPVPPTETPLPPTETPPPPTDTSLPPTDTATPVPPTKTPTPVPPTETPVPPTDTPVPLTDTATPVLAGPTATATGP